MARKPTKKQPTDAERLKAYMSERRARALSRLAEPAAERKWQPGKNIVKTASSDPNDLIVDYSAAKDGRLNNKERILLEIAASDFTDSKVSEALGGSALALMELMLAAATIEQLTVITEFHAFTSGDVVRKQGGAGANAAKTAKGEDRRALLKAFLERHKDRWWDSLSKTEKSLLHAEFHKENPNMPSIKKGDPPWPSESAIYDAARELRNPKPGT